MKRKLLSATLVCTMLMSMAPAMPAVAESVETPAIVATGATVAATTEALVADTSWYNDQDRQFTITTANALAGVAVLVEGGETFEGKTIFLGENIDMAGYTGWTPIGNDTHAFKGIFDGNNHAISNLTIETGGKYLALFGKGDDCVIQNLQMDGVTIHAQADDARVAAVAGFASGQSVIENVHVKNLKADNAKVVAGIVRSLGSGNQTTAPGATLRQCSVEQAKFTDCTYAHGMAYAVGKYAVMEDCRVVNVLIDRTQGSDTYGTGLFFMSADGALIKGCSTDLVTINNTVNAAGFLYKCGEDTVVEDCSARRLTFDNNQFVSGFSMFINTTGNVYRGCRVTDVRADSLEKGGAGMVYYIYPNLGAVLSDCHVDGVRLNTPGTAAGFIASAGSKTTAAEKALQCNQCSVNDVHLENAIQSAGFITSLGANSQLEGCDATNVTLANIATGAGLVRLVNGGSQLSQCRATNIRFIAPEKDLSFVGGMIGMANANVAISDSRVDGIVIQGKSGMQVGGFAGNVQNSSSTAPNTFTNCAVTGLDMQMNGLYPYKDNEHKSKVGGFIGTTGKIATFDNCSVQGRIQTEDSAGGFVGDLGWVSLSEENAKKYRSEFQNCTANVDVTAGETAGGFVGVAVSTYTQQNGKLNPEKSTASFTNCVAQGKTTSATGVAGGFVGSGDRGDYSNCRAEGPVAGDVAGGFFGKAVPNDFSDGTDTQVRFDNCSAGGTVLGTTQAGGFMGQAETDAAHNGDSDTVITFDSANTASPVVAGSKQDTVLDKVAKIEVTDQNNVNGLPTEMPNTAIVTPKGDVPLTMDEFGHIVIPEGGANKEDVALNPGDIITNDGALAQGGSIKEDGSIAVESGGSLTKPDGSVEEFPHGGTVGSDGNITQNPSPSVPSRPSYGITTPEVSNGVVEVRPGSAPKGTTITVIVTPDEGYVVEEVIVTDKNGARLALTETGKGIYTFVMPGGPVDVRATFKKGDASGGWDNPFVDVAADAWYNDAVRYVYENKLIMGVGTNQFGPNRTTDRGQLVTMLWRLSGAPEVATPAAFNDVAQNAYYAKAVAWAAENGVVAGFEDGSFRPSDGVSREQMAAIFMNYAKASGVDISARADLSGYADIQPNSWSYDALCWAKAVGLLSGVDDHTMAPKATATRAQIAAVLQRYCETVVK